MRICQPVIWGIIHLNNLISLQKRLISVFLLITFIFLLLIGRLFKVQVSDSEWLQAKAAEQWYRDLPLNATRGGINDANGVTLATSYSTYDVYVKPSRVENVKEVALTLNRVLGIEYDKAYTKACSIQFSEVLIKQQVDDGLAKKLINANVKGIVLSENSKRYYPYGDMLTQVLGYTTIDNVGQSGLELYYNEYLKGINGYALEESDVHGVKVDNSLSTYIPSIAGCGLNLTIDINIQKLCEDALMELCKDHAPKTATAIVMNPKTGEIVAMASKPSFDLNNIPRDNVSELMQNSKNLSIVDVYEPGSTFKVLTMAMALEEGVSTEEERFYDPGYRIVDGEKIKCWKLTGHGSQTLTEGLCNSCNSVLVDLALRLGKEKLYEYYSKFGFGKTLGVDFSGESAGILMDIESAKKVDYARMGFGQAIAVTPLQLISAICSVLNGGELLKPYFVKSITDANGNIVASAEKTVLQRTISQSTSERIKTMLEAVINQSYGIETFIPGYRISGKTGTSQKYEAGAINNKYVSSFVGAFPADDPEYVLLVIADEPSSGHYYGSIVATPYAKMIFQGIIDYKHYTPNQDTLESDIEKMEKNILLPNLVGLSITEACNTLTKLGLLYEIENDGNNVIAQFTPPNTYVYKGAVILLTT